MITTQQNLACKTVAEQAAINPLREDYATYCSLRGLGLRKEAFCKLESFISGISGWRFEEKKTFVLWLCELMNSVRDADYGPFPQPLKERVFRPFFEKWLFLEPTNDDAMVLKARYLQDPSAYVTAVRINPRNQPARRALARACIEAIDFATHHLPDYFIGEPAQTKEWVREAYDHLRYIEAREVLKGLKEELSYLESLLNDWMAYQQAPNGDFGEWCSSHGRNYRWIRSYNYDR